LLPTALHVPVNRWLNARSAKPLLFVCALLPLGWLLLGAMTGRLGPNPAEALVRSSGDWTLRFLCVALAVTPVRISLGLPPLARLRRMLGLFVFFYAVMHFLAYSWLDKGLEFSEIAVDIAKRPFILVGFVSLLLLSLLAATSWNGAVRRLGALRWQRLHRAVYLIAGLAILHFFWMRAAKNNFADVAVYGAVLGALLGWRVRRRWRSRQPPSDRSS
jgi:methionine sulfoxide reductase heme-binding subunit